MATNVGELAKLLIFKVTYRSDYQRGVLERALDMLIALDQERAQREPAALPNRLRAFENHYPVSPEQFYQRYEQGDLGDSADFMEWSSFYDMRQLVQQHLDPLAGQIP